MAYRRKQVTRSATFVEEFRSPPPPPPPPPNESSSAADVGYVGGDGDSSSSSSPSSLAAQAIRASAAHRDSSSLSSAYGESAFTSSAAATREANRFRRSATCTSSRDAATYEYTSMRSLNESKYGFWGVLARKAKSILEDDNDNASQQPEDPGRSRQQMLETRTGGQFNGSYSSPDSYRKTENSTFNRSSEAISSSLHHIGGTIKNALEEGMTIVESRTADIIQETRKLQIRRKTGSPNALNVATDLSAPNALSPKQNDHETQLKASRDVANAMAAKAKLLLRELKTVKADLAFAQERCTQLEEENRLLRESRQKGDNHEDEDLIRLQLETLLEEKGRLAHENSVYARENRFLREIVEYHQLTMQDVIYVDERIEEVSEVCPITMSPYSSRTSSASLPPINSRSASPNKSSPPLNNDKGAPEDKGIEDKGIEEKKGATPPPPKAKGLRRQRSSTQPS